MRREVNKWEERHKNGEKENREGEKGNEKGRKRKRDAKNGESCQKGNMERKSVTVKREVSHVMS